jgi:hypothetical protein
MLLWKDGPCWFVIGTTPLLDYKDHRMLSHEEEEALENAVEEFILQSFSSLLRYAKSCPWYIVVICQQLEARDVPFGSDLRLACMHVHTYCTFPARAALQANFSAAPLGIKVQG